MKKLISKIKRSYHRFMTGKSGFSLVELIVVIAIMAVMAAVLAPSLLGYVEKSRMQKDDSAMDEVVNAIQLSLADQSIYDEVLEHSVWDNVSCYIDKKDESQFADCKVQLKAANGDKKEQYMFGDEARLLDETVYYAAGNMRGLTITWSPNESGDTYDFANGILNKFVGRKTGLLSENPELYNRLRSVIGDKLDTTSQTYRNSDYTIFIRVGSTGGAEAVMQDAIQVWGQFNGTNLAEKDHKFELSSGRVVGDAGAFDEYDNNQKNQSDDKYNFGENAILTMVIDGQEYQYEKTMTWREWFHSDYNTTNWHIITLDGYEYISKTPDIQTCTHSRSECSPGSSVGGAKENYLLLNFHCMMPTKEYSGITWMSDGRVDLDYKVHLPSYYERNDCIEDYSEFVSYRFYCGGNLGGPGFVGMDILNRDGSLPF